MNEQKLNKIVFLKTHNTSLWVFLFFLLGLFIRLYKLGDHNLWFDELYSLKAIREISLLDIDYNPPFYYILLSFWIRYFGPTLAKFFDGEFILRSLSMIFGIISIPLIYKLGKQFFNARVSLISAFILSISPIHVWYSQEARGYSLAIFLTMLTVYFFCFALRKNNLYLWIGFVMSSLLALLTVYFSFFIIILVGIFFVFKTYRSLFKFYLSSLCFISFAFLPFLPLLLKQIAMVKSLFWIPKPHINSIAITFKNFNIGYNATPNIYLFTFIIFSFLFLLGILGWWKEKKKELISLVSLVFAPIIVTFLISQKKSIYIDRQLLLFSPFYYIIIGAGLAKIRMRILKIVAYLSILVPILFCLHNYFTYHMPLPLPHHMGVHSKKPIKPAADYINSRFKEGDLVALSDISITQIVFYIPNIPKKQIAYFFIESKFKNVRFLYNGLKKSLESQLKRGLKPNIVNLGEKSITPGVKDIGQLDFDRIWLISSSWLRDGKLDAHVEAVRQFMRNHYSLFDSKEFDGIFIDLYVRKID